MSPICIARSKIEKHTQTHAYSNTHIHANKIKPIIKIKSRTTLKVQREVDAVLDNLSQGGKSLKQSF